MPARDDHPDRPDLPEDDAVAPEGENPGAPADELSGMPAEDERDLPAGDADLDGVEPGATDVDSDGDPVEVDEQTVVDADVAPAAADDVAPDDDTGIPVAGSGSVEDDDAQPDDVDADAEGAVGQDAATATTSPSRSTLLPAVVAGLAVIGILAGLFFLFAGSDDPAYVVYGEAVSRAELRERLDGLVSPAAIEAVDDPAAAPPEQQAALSDAMNSLITLDVLTAAAAERGESVDEAQVDEAFQEVVDGAFDGDADLFRAQLERDGVRESTVRTQLRTRLLARAIIGEDAVTVSEDELRQAYELEFALPTVSHILTETEAEADAALARIKGGEAFEAVAQDVSIDPGSAPRGGELGPLRPGVFVEVFEEAALALEEGEVSDPIETELGFHVLTVGPPVPFEEIGDQLAQALEEQNLVGAFADLSDQLDADAAVEVDPVYGVWRGLSQGLAPPGIESEVLEDPAVPTQE